MFRIASVSFLNARPLIHGLERDPRIKLLLDVPSRLHDLLRKNQADAALLPVIDYQRLDNMTIIPAGGIGSDGATLTVRIFSRVPIAQMKSLACDPDSHTSVALARIILARRHNLRPEFTDLARANDDDPTQARLLIGDKVVCEGPRGYPHQLDLGAEWKALTEFPFVFATWMARNDVPELPQLHGLLTEAKHRGLAELDAIIRDHGVPRGWPAPLAHAYLTRHLTFNVGEREIESIRLFHRYAAEEGIIPAARELVVLPDFGR
jgi:chorismate dehydratase